MSDWRLALVRAREEFIEELSRRGFRFDARTKVLQGSVNVPGIGTRGIEITIGDGFPYVAPKVRPNDDAGHPPSWHQERDGSLCLWSSEARHPWLEADALLERVVRWFVRDATGWLDDEADLDLERYFDRQDGLVVYRDIDRLMNHRIRTSLRGPVIRVTGIIPNGEKVRHDQGFWGWAASLGELSSPVHDWASISYAFGSKAASIADEIRKGKGHLLLLHYTRGPHSAAIALRASPGAPVRLSAYEVASEGAATLRLRAGSNAATLSTKAVAMVGIGAVGSFLADLLMRSGVRRLHLQDGQTLRPGNCIRHLVGTEFVGWNKAHAVREVLGASGNIDIQRVEFVPRSLLTPEDAHSLLARHDLVIDAAASATTTSMLAALAITTGPSLLSVCVQREGGVVRCDRWPLREGESHLPAVPRGAAMSTVREAGCGDPVSMTSPGAVLAAAELACRMAIDVLTGANLLPPTVVHVLERQADPPYDRVAILA